MIFLYTLFLSFCVYIVLACVEYITEKKILVVYQKSICVVVLSAEIVIFPCNTILIGKPHIQCKLAQFHILVN